MRFLLYSHDGLGLGHTRRHLAIATALSELVPDVPVLVATGIDDVARLGLPANVGALKLPSLRKAGNGDYISRHLHVPASEIRALRASLLLAAVKSFRPTVVLVDKHPFGASGEFRAAITALRRYGGGTILGLRDILDEPQAVRKEWNAHRLLKGIDAYYDEVLIYGHASVFNPAVEYGFPPALAKRTHFCGYVVNREPPKAHSPELRPSPALLQDRTRPMVLASAGGGEDGFHLLENFMEAAAGAPWQGLVVTGPMIPEPQWKTLQRQAAESGVTLRNFVPDLSELFWSAGALVCMGGYNTLAEAVSKGMPTVCVPRTVPRKEQLLRALAFERLGLLRVVRPEELNPELLRENINAALKLSRQHLLGRVNSVLAFDGARQAARRLLALAVAKESLALVS